MNIHLYPWDVTALPCPGVRSRGSVYGLQSPTHRSQPFGHHGMISAVHLGARLRDAPMATASEEYDIWHSNIYIFLHLIWCIYIYLFIYIYNGRAWFVEPYSNGTGSLWSMLLGTEHFSVAHGFSVSMWHITKSSMGFMFQVHALASKFFIFRRLHH